MKRIASFAIVCILCVGMLTACRSGSGSNTSATTTPITTTLPDMGNMLPGPEDTIDPTNGANAPDTDGTIDPTNGANEPDNSTTASTPTEAGSEDTSRMLPRRNYGR